MKIVIDDKIPYIREAISSLTGDAVYLKGAAITPEDVRDADALIVRTRTRCDGRLLEGSSVRFVATATIGFDHIDTDYMQRAGITWMSCPPPWHNTYGRCSCCCGATAERGSKA